MSDVEKMDSDEIGIIVSAHKDYLDSGKPHIDLKEFMTDWINKKEVTEQTPEEVEEWSASSDEGESFNQKLEDVIEVEENKEVHKEKKFENKEEHEHKEKKTEEMEKHKEKKIEHEEKPKSSR